MQGASPLHSLSKTGEQNELYNLVIMFRSRNQEIKTTQKMQTFFTFLGSNFRSSVPMHHCLSDVAIFGQGNQKAVEGFLQTIWIGYVTPKSEVLG